MNKKSPEISINLTSSDEGLMLYKTLRCIRNMCNRLEGMSVTFEINVSLDCADELTAGVANDFKHKNPGFRINLVDVNYRDKGLSRNYLASISSGRYIAVLNGGDLYTQNYLLSAYTKSEESKKPTIYSPKFLICFDESHYMTVVRESSSVDPVSLFDFNYLPDQYFAPRNAVVKNPYSSNSGVYSSEGWRWSTQMINDGYEFKVIDDSIYFFRYKEDSLGQIYNVKHKTIIAPTPLFKPTVFIEKAGSPSYAPISANDSQSTNASLRTELKKHILIHHYVKTMVNLHLGTLDAVARRYRINIVNPMKKHETHMDRAHAAISRGIPVRLKVLGIDEAVVKEWRLLNDIEPNIRPSWDMLEYIPIVDTLGYPKMGVLYRELCGKYGMGMFDDVVLVPHLVRGGADLATVHLINALSKKGKVLLITTTYLDSPWLKLVNELPNVTCIDGSIDLISLSDSEKEYMIIQLIQNWNPKRLTVINSEIGYDIVALYGDALKMIGCDVYIHTYAYDMTEDGYLYFGLKNRLLDAYPAVKYLLTDSKAYKKQLVSINGFSEEKIKELYLPTTPGILSKKDFSLKKSVLWASRVHPNKLVEDVLLKIGQKLDAMGIELHIYGALSEDFTMDSFTKLIKDYPKIKYMGAYDGFSSIPVDNYDMFLLTTKNEGMPNVILEACMADILVIAPPVGGIAETIVDGENGILVGDKFDASSYVESINSAYNNNKFSNKKNIIRINDTIRARHSMGSYCGSIYEIMQIDR